MSDRATGRVLPTSELVSLPEAKPLPGLCRDRYRRSERDGRSYSEAVLVHNGKTAGMTQLQRECACPKPRIQDQCSSHAEKEFLGVPTLADFILCSRSLCSAYWPTQVLHFRLLGPAMPPRTRSKRRTVYPALPRVSGTSSGQGLRTFRALPPTSA